MGAWTKTKRNRDESRQYIRRVWILYAVEFDPPPCRQRIAGRQAVEVSTEEIEPDPSSLAFDVASEPMVVHCRFRSCCSRPYCLNPHAQPRPNKALRRNEKHNDPSLEGEDEFVACRRIEETRDLPVLGIPISSDLMKKWRQADRIMYLQG